MFPFIHFVWQWRAAKSDPLQENRDFRKPSQRHELESLHGMTQVADWLADERTAWESKVSNQIGVQECVKRLARFNKSNGLTVTNSSFAIDTPKSLDCVRFCCSHPVTRAVRPRPGQSTFEVHSQSFNRFVGLAMNDMAVFCKLHRLLYSKRSNKSKSPFRLDHPPFDRWP